MITFHRNFKQKKTEMENEMSKIFPVYSIDDDSILE